MASEIRKYRQESDHYRYALTSFAPSSGSAVAQWYKTRWRSGRIWGVPGSSEVRDGRALQGSLVSQWLDMGHHSDLQEPVVLSPDVGWVSSVSQWSEGTELFMKVRSPPKNEGDILIAWTIAAMVYEESEVGVVSLDAKERWTRKDKI